MRISSGSSTARWSSNEWWWALCGVAGAGARLIEIFLVSCFATFGMVISSILAARVARLQQTLSVPLFFSAERLQVLAHERGKVVGLSRRHEVAVDDHFLVHVRRARVDHVVLDREEAG